MNRFSISQWYRRAQGNGKLFDFWLLDMKLSKGKRKIRVRTKEKHFWLNDLLSSKRGGNAQAMAFTHSLCSLLALDLFDRRTRRSIQEPLLKWAENRKRKLRVTEINIDSSEAIRWVFILAYQLFSLRWIRMAKKQTSVEYRDAKLMWRFREHKHMKII